MVDAAAANVRLTMLLANTIVKQPTTTAHNLLTPDIIKSYITQALPTGTDFLACRVLAPVSSFGYNGEPAMELDSLATAFDLSVADLRAAARSLKDAGLLSEQGRYRSVTPHPLAIFLAARGWEDLHDRIETGLLPVIDESMTERLLQRAAQVGDHPAIRDAVQRLLGPGGVFETLDVWAGGSLTVYLAALAPKAICDRVSAAVAAMSDEELRTGAGHRQALVWTLEKLAWRPVAFRCAADALLRLAAVGLNAGSDKDPAGRCWTDLFGTLLPATAARPPVRLQYLRDVATSVDRRHRLLAVAAAGRALERHEMVVASAEDQGGVLVERRGSPATWGDAYDYLETMIDLLGILAHDADPEVANKATTELVDAIRPLVPAVPRVRNRLAAVVASLPEAGLTAARQDQRGVLWSSERGRSGSHRRCVRPSCAPHAPTALQYLSKRISGSGTKGSPGRRSRVGPAQGAAG